MELIRGRWYKTPAGTCFKYIESGNQCHYGSEYITPNKVWFVGKGIFRYDFKGDTFIEVSLSEIQQYFPEGHPDKEFVLPEKWCVKDCDEVSKWASKVFGCGCFVNSSKYLCVKVEKFPNFDFYCFYSKESASNYTEITFEEFKKYVLKQDDMKEKPIYVKVVDFGKEYSTHSDAREYGMTNYFYWTHGSPRLNSATKYRVVKKVIVNKYDESYILLDESTGYEYLIQTKGCKIIENMKEKEIIGYKLKEDRKQYEEVAKKIAGYTNGGITEFEQFLRNTTYGKNGFVTELQDAGVLELWFEPIYREEFKVGDWIMETWEHSPYFNKKAFRINNIKNKVVKYNRDGECGCGVDYVRLATPEEIKKTLVEEAVKRGFKEGVKVRSLIHNKDLFCNKTINGFKYYPDYDKLHFGSDGVSCVVIYENGKWAEILPSYPQIEINGYKGEFFDNYVKFGCAEISKEVFIDLVTCREYKNTNRDIESVTIGKGTFTKEQIKQIAEYYINKK